MKLDKRTVKCEDCGNVWGSMALPKNLKCKKCKSTNISEKGLEVANSELKKAEETAKEAVKMVEAATKMVENNQPPVCGRCKGDGTWHSVKTGYRALTSSEPLQDASRPCPECV